MFIQKSSIEKAKSEAMEEGLEKGLKEGEKIGEAKKAIEIAKISISQGLDTETISIITGLSILEIDKLRKL